MTYINQAGTPIIKDFGITVDYIKPVGLRISLSPDFEYAYYEGESFSPTGMDVIAIYNNNTERTLSSSEYSVSHGIVNPNEQIIVTHTGNTTMGPVTVSERVPVNVTPIIVMDLERISGPNKSIYAPGETFSATGLIVKATFNNGVVDNNFTGYGISPNRPLAEEDTEILINAGNAMPLRISIVVRPTPTVETPLASLEPGRLIPRGTEIELYTLTSDAIIRYTLNGFEPNESSMIYMSPIVLNSNTTVKAKAFTDGMTASDTATFNYRVYDPDALTISAVNIAASAGEIVELPIEITNNGLNDRGIGVINNLRIEFDDTYLEWVGTAAQSIVTGGMLDYATPMGGNFSSKHANLTFDSEFGTKSDGTLVTFKFKIKNDAPIGSIPVALTVSSIGDDALMPNVIPASEYNIFSGSIAVIIDVVYGDVNEDENIDGFDVTLLRRYIADWPVVINERNADVNADGAIDGFDVTLLRRYIADWPVTLGPIDQPTQQVMPVSSSMLTVSNESEKLTIAVGSATADAGDTVDIPILITNNGINDRGIAVINNLRIAFDDTYLEWIGTAAQSIATGGMLDYATPQGGNFTSTNASLTFDSEFGTKSDGTLVTFKFIVKEDAPSGDINLTLTVVSIGDDALMPNVIPASEYDVISGKIQVGPILPDSAQVPVIDTQPIGGTVTKGTTHDLTVGATSPDGGTLSYQWFSNSSATNSNGTLIQDATSKTYAAPISTVGAYYYYVVVTNTITDNGDGGVKTATTASNAVTLIVSPPPDTTPPTGEITIGIHDWNSFWNFISFGLFAKETQSVTITAQDDSGDPVAIQYYLSDVFFETVAELEATAVWQDYSIQFNIDPNKEYIIYAKLTDSSQNVVYINSAGIVLYTDSTFSPTVISFTRGSGADQTVGATLYGNTIQKIMNGAATLSHGADYTVSASAITFKASYLESLTAGTHTLVIYSNPLGIEYPSNPLGGSNGPAPFTISLTVNSQNAQPPNIDTQPMGGTVAVGTTHNLTVGATSPDNGTLSYQWYSNSNATINGGSPIPGATNATFAAPIVTADTYYYYVVVTNTITDNGDGGTKSVTATSDPVTLTVNIIDPCAEGHTPGAPATCTTAQTCTVCSEVIVAVLGHDLHSAWTVRTAATCEVVGEEYRQCSRFADCGHEETQGIPALGHDLPDTWTERTAATCTVAGEEYRRCSRYDDCNHEETQSILAIGHDYGAWGNNTATCTVGGTETCTCSYACGEPGEADSRVTPPLGHDMPSTWTVRSVATCEVVGEEYRRCSRYADCSHEETQSIAILEHNWVSDNDGTHHCTAGCGVTNEVCSPNTHGATCAKCGYVAVNAFTNANLSSLSVSSGTLTPALNATTTIYTVSVGNSVSSITIMAVASNTSATVDGDGQKSLSVGANTITITVTAEDGTTKKTYTITVTRESGGGSVVTPPPTTPPGEDITNPDIPLDPGDSSWENPYIDVSDTVWFYDAVRFVTEEGLMKGSGGGRFSPNVTLTRAMIVTILYRLEGEPDVSGEMQFPDVKSGEWYSEAILWANQNGIVFGYGNGTFGWNDPVTREQAVTILFRYAKFKDLDVSASADLSKFTDMDDISDWAQDAMKWAVAVGIVQGRPGNRTAPGDTSNRAEIAMIFKRYIEDFLGASGVDGEPEE